MAAMAWPITPHAAIKPFPAGNNGIKAAYKGNVIFAAL